MLRYGKPLEGFLKRQLVCQAKKMMLTAVLKLFEEEKDSEREDQIGNYFSNGTKTEWLGGAIRWTYLE